LLYNLRAYYMDATTFHRWMDEMANWTTPSEDPAANPISPAEGHSPKPT
jgi:hypothetical protein